MAPDVTVSVPVLNGARYLDEVLTAVRAQRTDREHNDYGRYDLEDRLARVVRFGIWRVRASQICHVRHRRLPGFVPI